MPYFIGIPTHVLINSTGIEYPSTLNDLELVDLRGNSIAKYPLVRDPEISTLYNVTSFVPPEQYFYVKVNYSSFIFYCIVSFYFYFMRVVKKVTPVWIFFKLRLGL